MKIHSFIGITFHIVAPETEIGKDSQGNPVFVTDESVVFKGAKAWCTQSTYDKLKEAVK